MANEHVSESETSEVDLLKAPNTPSQKNSANEASPPISVLSHRYRESPPKSSKRKSRESSADKIAVMVAGPARPWEYEPYQGNNTVHTVLESMLGPNNKAWYKIEYEDGKTQNISIDNLIKLRNGQNALNFFNNEDSDDMESENSQASSLGIKRTRTRNGSSKKKLDIENLNIDDSDDDEEVAEDNSVTKKRRIGKARVGTLAERESRQSSRVGNRASKRLTSRPSSKSMADTHPTSSEASESEEDSAPSRVTRNAGRHLRGTNNNSASRGKAKAKEPEVDELAGETLEQSGDSDILYDVPRRNRRSTQTRRGRSPAVSKRGRQRKPAVESSPSPERIEPTRKSGRDRQVKSMREMDMDEEIYADEVVKNSAPKVISIREIYQPVPKDSAFSEHHNPSCDVCGGFGKDSNKGISPLIYCQGCSSSIHKVCLGYRSAREPMVTKIGHENFVMQCRRCIGVYTKKDPSAPRLDVCQGCKKKGKACAAFSTKKTAKAEEKIRQDNNGDDPVTEVSPELINNADAILFRCTGCYRGWHFDHLPPLYESSKTPTDIRAARLAEYTDEWQCKECTESPSKVQSLVAWRTIDRKVYDKIKNATFEDFTEDQKEYLLKWHETSYFQCTWMPGAWVWGVTATAMRKAFIRRGDGVNEEPKFSTEEAIPEEFLRMEIIFEVEYDDDYETLNEVSDKANISAVERVLVKWLGLGYEESVWEVPPKPDDADRWKDFVAAYNEYVAGKYFEFKPVEKLQERVDKFRKLNFTKKVEMKKQPASLVGGEMMPYQLDGLNWLLYNFHKQKNVILADEMGLGKTIQIISMLAALGLDNPKCWPFLVVTPNSTCPNWRREIKKWAPNLRVVAYYGPKAGRDMAMKHELFPNGCKDMRAHVVVTSYEGPVEEHSKAFFKRIKWVGMVVDEGQRLKNDENLLYLALTALKVPFQVLLTGTPLQNNKRELFNLLQFLDSTMKAAELDEEYEELTNENIPKLHNLIRPFFLRRTKVQVLKFLPPMAQVILPVSMSLVQKKLYKSILEKNPELIRTIMGTNKAVVSLKERGNLNNILMQLRKCLCHPFIYSSAIEETKLSKDALERNLIDASSKFQLLEIMLPKLKERGHRVLLFSQFLKQLDLVEDFLNTLGLQFQRLDGNINALEKQKRIDAFNAPNSELFAFLLSTRAGGVGINLATADTVIIMDPDFNPHQDLQALSRAHRIGQKKKVLVFQLMTKDSAEEKIVHIGRKKMALDQALIEQMDAEDDAGVDLESILAYGAAALFNDDDRNDIRYDSSSVDKLLDRTQVENTKADDENTAESHFSFARIWANDKGDLTEDLDEEAPPPDPSFWEDILKKRETEAALEASRNLQTFGRGKRARQTVDYHRAGDNDDDLLVSPALAKNRRPRGSDVDSNFGSVQGESEKEEESDPGDTGVVDPQELGPGQENKAPSGKGRAYVPKVIKDLKNGKLPPPGPPKLDQLGRPIKNKFQTSGVDGRDTQRGQYTPYGPVLSSHQFGSNGNIPPGFNISPQMYGGGYPNQHGPGYAGPPGSNNGIERTAGFCNACRKVHLQGKCGMRWAEVCNLCNLAHYSFITACPNLRKVSEIRKMIDALNQSQESREQIETARNILYHHLRQASSMQRPQNVHQHP